MRRKDREITDINDIMSIIKKCDVCNVAFFDEEFPYVVPLNFGIKYESGKIEIYFHCANQGTKLVLLKKNKAVAFDMSCSQKLIAGEKACDYTMEFESVCGNGYMEILNENEKINGLMVLMSQYSAKENHEFDENILKAVTVLKLSVNEISGKRLKIN